RVHVHPWPPPRWQLQVLDPLLCPYLTAGKGAATDHDVLRVHALQRPVCRVEHPCVEVRGPPLSGVELRSWACGGERPEVLMSIWLPPDHPQVNPGVMLSRGSDKR